MTILQRDLPEKKIRVAIMADEFDRRPERSLYFRRLIEGLIADPTIDLTLVHPKPMPDEPLYQQVREVVLPRIELPFATRFVSFIRYCLTTKDEYDIVQWLMPRPFPFFWLFPAKKYVIMAHGGGDVLLPGMRTFAREVFNYTITWFQKYIDVMIAVSEYGNKEIIYAYHIPPEKVKTIYVAADPIYYEKRTDNEIQEVLSKHNLHRGTYFFFTGRFRLHKNVGNLVQAYLLYRENNLDKSERLVLAGTPEDFEKTFGSVPSSPYTKDIHFIGYVPTSHLPALYTGAVALSFVTISEGFGLPVIEAMACGTPVITSSVTALPEVAGNAGIIVDPYSPEALAEAMALITKNERVRTTLVERGLERAKYFTYERNIKNTVALYHDLFNHSSVVFDISSDTIRP
jgi:glycosyltransferase involved in cell wall biosynthesis